jgi:hypothetical protein
MAFSPSSVNENMLDTPKQTQGRKGDRDGPSELVWPDNEVLSFHNLDILTPCKSLTHNERVAGTETVLSFRLAELRWDCCLSLHPQSTYRMGTARKTAK